jgi:hypothetical protein
MLSVRRLLLGLATSLLLLACQPAGPARGGLEGAWKVVQLSVTTPDTSRTITDPQPSLYLFTSGHYSFMHVPDAAPRAQFRDMTRPTDPEKVAAFNSFIANSGTYVLSDSTIETHLIVAKTPNIMGQTQTYLYRLSGDSLSLTGRPLPAPDVEVRATLVRIN